MAQNSLCNHQAIALGKVESQIQDVGVCWPVPAKHMYAFILVKVNNISDWNNFPIFGK